MSGEPDAPRGPVVVAGAAPVLVPGATPSTFTAAYRVRFDEAGADGLARTASLLRYAQDLAWLHSGALGYERAWYVERGLAWLARAVEVTVLGPLRSGEDVVLTTRVVAGRRVRARRVTEGVTAAGDPVVRVITDWAMTDARGVPARIPDEFGAAFGVPPLDFEPLRVAAEPPPGARVVPGLVRARDLDPMGHANNTAYVDWLEEAVAAAGGEAQVAVLPRTLRLEYLVPAAPGTELRLVAWRDGEAWVHALAGADGRALARGRLAPG